MMTRKDYVAFANALGDAALREPELQAGIIRAARAVADVLGADNPAFRREQFLEAFGYAAEGRGIVKVGQTRFDK